MPRRLELLAHEVELRTALLAPRDDPRPGVAGELAGREDEVEPSVPAVEELELEHVAKEGARGVRVVRVEKHVHAVDHSGRA